MEKKVEEKEENYVRDSKTNINSMGKNAVRKKQ